MPFALVLIGLLLIVTGSKDTYKQFGNELVSDFTGDGNFTWWIASIGAVGALGYIKPLEGFSRLFMGLIILSMIVSNRGVFAQLTSALQSGPVSPEQPSNDLNGIVIQPKATPVDFADLPNPTERAQATASRIVEIVKIFL